MALKKTLARRDGTPITDAYVHLNYVEVQRRDQVARVQLVAYASEANKNAVPPLATDRVFDHSFGPEHWATLVSADGITEPTLYGAIKIMAQVLADAHDEAVAAAEAAGTAAPVLSERSLAHLAGATDA